LHRHVRTICLVVAIGLVAGACGERSGGPAPTDATQRSIEAIADEYLEAMLERYPEYGTYYGIEGSSHDALTDNSLEALAAWQAREDAWLAELDAVGRRTVIGSRDWVTYGVLHEELEASVGRRICRQELWSASTTTAWYTGLPFVFDMQPLEDEEAQAAALTRLGQVAGFIDTEIGNLRHGLELGYSAPRITVEAVPGEVRALLDDDNPFLKMASRTGDDAFRDRVTKIYENEIAAAIEGFAAFIETEYLPAARGEIALSANPDGAECYPRLVRSFATVSPSADEIHRVGLDQMNRIRAEMKGIIDEHFGGGEVRAFLRTLKTDPRYTFESEEAVLQYAIDALEKARPRMSEVFSTLPKADVEIKPYPAYRASGTGEYHSSSEDGTRPGIFYISVLDPGARSRANQQSFLYHETLPGHHLQSAIALELGERVHPLARYLYNSGYGEGWGLYAEYLAGEMGLLNGPLEEIGRLNELGTRAARLVVDTGLHTKGWTRQQALDTMHEISLWPDYELESEINRYISWPGQAVSYTLGMLEILRLRSLAEERLGDGFDIREFHARVLENGSVTLPMLEQAVLAWVDGLAAAETE
jgi:uncharacterized protein (DUF885 family)